MFYEPQMLGPQKSGPQMSVRLQIIGLLRKSVFTLWQLNFLKQCYKLQNRSSKKSYDLEGPKL